MGIFTGSKRKKNQADRTRGYTWRIKTEEGESRKGGFRQAAETENPKVKWKE